MGTKNSTSTQSNQPSKQALDAYKYVGNVAKNAAGLPLQQYQGPTVAGFTPDQQAAFQGVENAQGIGNPYINTASQLASQGSAPQSYIPQVGTNAISGIPQVGTGQVNAQQIGAGPQVGTTNSNYSNYNPEQFSQAGISQFYNPYQQDVINTTMANINQNNSLAQNDLLGRAISSGANPFGGDRAGLAAAELERNQGLARNQTIAGLENQGYNTALGAFQSQQGLNTQAGLQNAGQNLNAQQGNAANLLTASGQNAANWLTGQQANQNAGLQAGLANATNQLSASGQNAQLGYNTAAQNAANQLAASGQNATNYLNTAQNNATNAFTGANLYGNLGQQAQNQALTGASALLQTGGLQQGLNQQQLNVPYQQFQQQQQYPMQQAQFLINSLSGNPTNLGSTTTTTQPGPSPLNAVAGLATAGLGLIPGVGKRGGEVGKFAGGGLIHEAVGGVVDSLGGYFANGGMGQPAINNPHTAAYQLGMSNPQGLAQEAARIQAADPAVQAYMALVNSGAPRADHPTGPGATSGIGPLGAALGWGGAGNGGAFDPTIPGGGGGNGGGSGSSGPGGAYNPMIPGGGLGQTIPGQPIPGQAIPGLGAASPPPPQLPMGPMPSMASAPPPGMMAIQQPQSTITPPMLSNQVGLGNIAKGWQTTQPASLNPTSTVPSYINAMPQIGLDAMPDPLVTPLPKTVRKAIKDVPAFFNKGNNNKGGKGKGSGKGGKDWTPQGHVGAGNGSNSLAMDKGGIASYAWSDPNPPFPTDPADYTTGLGGFQENYNPAPLSGVAAATAPSIAPVPEVNKSPDVTKASAEVVPANSYPTTEIGKNGNAVIKGADGSVYDTGLPHPSTFTNSPRDAFFQAGATMAASPSPFPLQAIGEGAAKGIESYVARKQENQKLAAEQSLEQQKLQILREQMGMPQTDLAKARWDYEHGKMTKEEYQLIIDKVMKSGNPEEPAAIKIARAMGLKEGTPEWNKYLEQSSMPPSTTIDMAAKPMAGVFADDYKSVRDLAASARDSDNLLGRMAQISQDPNFYSGTAADINLFFKRASAALGGNPNAAKPMEEYAALSNKAVIAGLHGSLGTGVSNADRGFIADTVPTLYMTPAGNAARIETQHRLNQRAQQIAALADDWIDPIKHPEHGGTIGAGWTAYLAQWGEANPLFADLNPRNSDGSINKNSPLMPLIDPNSPRLMETQPEAPPPAAATPGAIPAATAPAAALPPSGKADYNVINDPLSLFRR